MNEVLTTFTSKNTKKNSLWKWKWKNFFWNQSQSWMKVYIWTCLVTADCFCWATSSRPHMCHLFWGAGFQGGLCSHWLCKGRVPWLSLCYLVVTLASQEVVRSKSAAWSDSKASCTSQEHFGNEATEGIYKRRLTRAGRFWMVWGVDKVMVSIAQKD